MGGCAIEERGSSTGESRAKVRCGGVARAEVGGRRCAEGYQMCADAGAWVCRGRCAVIVKCKRGGLMRVGGGADAAAEGRRDEGRIRFGGGARTDLYCYLCRVSQ